MSAMNNLPANWTVKPLGEACKTIKGKKPKNTGPAAVERSVPYINIKAFETGQAEEFAAPGNYPSCERDDVLIVWDGARAGLTGRAVPGYIGSTLAKVYSEEADNRYLFYFLQSQYGRINSRTKGVGIPHVDPTIFNNIPFPIAPLDQQKRIVAEIEKQFSRLDEAVANLKRVKANLKRYKAAVLKAAVEGRLVETEAERACREGRSYETGVQLLQRILETRRSQWKGKGKYKEPAVPDTTDLPELPNGWVWASLEMISDAIGGYAFSSKSFTSSGDQVVKMANVRMGLIDLTQRPSFVSKVDDVIRQKYGLVDGDVLVTLTGTRRERDYGYVAVVRNPPRLLLNQRIARLRAESGIAPDFLALTLQSESYRNRFFARETGNVGQGNVGMAAVTIEAVPVAPLAEQQRIVAEVDRRLSLLSKTEVQVDANHRRAERLRQSLLADAFGKRITRETNKKCA